MKRQPELDFFINMNRLLYLSNRKHDNSKVSQLCQV